MVTKHKEQSPRVTAVVVAYGPVPLLGRCVESLCESEGVDVDVVVVDNGITATGADTIVTEGRARIVGSGENLGFGGGCNLGVAVSTAPVVAFVNPDVVVGRQALAALTAALGDDSVGIASARVRLLEEPELLNSAGGAMHFLGLGWAQGFRAHESTATEARTVTGASGAAMAMRRQLFDLVGGFTPELFLYQEDLELSIRCWQMGYRVEFVPEANVWHHYEFSRNPGKFYYLERNRLILVTCLYEKRTIALLFPALVAFELGILLLAALQGWLGEKLRGWRWLLANRAWLVRHRRQLQQRRVVGDRELLTLLSARFDAGQVTIPRLLWPIDWALAWYWRLVMAVRRVG